MIDVRSYQCALCGTKVVTAEPELVGSSVSVTCSEACEEQLWWVLAKGPPFGAAVTQPRNDVDAKRQKTR